MNILGHPFVAYKVIGKMDKYVAAGADINDMVPFVPNSTFTFKEIHESPEIFLKCLDKKHPEKRHLALAMMSHSVKFGADKFNRTIVEWLLGNNKELTNNFALKISDLSKITFKQGRKSRLHNYLWSGADIHILKNHPKFVEETIKAYEGVDLEEISELLAECFSKQKDLVLKDLKYLFSPLETEGYENLKSVNGLVKLWKPIMAGLPEKDNVDEKKCFMLFNEIYKQFQSQWEKIIGKVVKDTKKRMEPYLHS